MICVSIGESSAEECIKALEGLDFAEIRLDKIDGLTEDAVHRIFSQPVKLMATCRPGTLPENVRKALLIRAIESGAAFVDIEAESRDEYKKEIIEKARTHNCTVIISFHNHKRTPTSAELKRTIDRCFESGADIAKIACMVNSKKDCARLLGLLDSERKVIVIGMGKMGRITRIVAPLLGSPFTFVSLRRGKETAEGQMEKNELEKLMREICHE